MVYVISAARGLSIKMVTKDLVYNVVTSYLSKIYVTLVRLIHLMSFHSKEIASSNLRLTC